MKRLHLLLPFLILFSISACKKPAQPEFKKLTNVKFGSLIKIDNGFGVKMKGDAVLFNPNSVGVPISGMDFDLYADGKKVSHITQDVTAQMPANGDFTLPLNFGIPLEEVFRGFKPTIRELMNKRSVKVKVDGHLVVKPAGVELKIPVTYEDDYEVALKDLINF